MVSGCTPTTLHLSALRLEYDPGQPRPPRVNAVTWHPDVGFLDEWSAHSAGKWSFSWYLFPRFRVRGFTVLGDFTSMIQGGALDMRQEPSTKWNALILRALIGEACIHYDVPMFLYRAHATLWSLEVYLSMSPIPVMYSSNSVQSSCMMRMGRRWG